MLAEHSFLLNFFLYSLRAFTALFWGILLFSYRKRSLQNLPLSIIFIIIGLLYLRNSFVRLPAIEVCDIYNPLSYFVLIFIAPFTIFYAYFALGEKHGKKELLMHFVPFAVLFLLWIAIRISDIPRIPFCYSLTELLGYAGLYPVYAGFFILMMLVFASQVITYFTVVLRRLVRVWKLYKLHGVSLRPVKILIAMDFLFLIYPLTCMVFMSYYNYSWKLGMSFNIFVSVVITLLSILNLKLILPIRTDLSFMPTGQKGQKQEVDAVAKKTDADKNLVAKITAAFDEREVYKSPNLRLQDLATELGTNRTYLSDCINSYFGCNFNQLLIRYRIGAAKELLLNTDMTIQEIIDGAGFNTRSSFYKAFKENISEDMSPVDWRKQQLKGAKRA